MRLSYTCTILLALFVFQFCCNNLQKHVLNAGLKTVQICFRFNVYNKLIFWKGSNRFWFGDLTKKYRRSFIEVAKGFLNLREPPFFHCKVAVKFNCFVCSVFVSCSIVVWFCLTVFFTLQRLLYKESTSFFLMRIFSH